MTTSITRFQLPSGIPTEAVKDGFLEVAPKFKHPAGLLRKYFLSRKTERLAAASIYGTPLRRHALSPKGCCGR
jgi:hypothetical protein